MNKIWDLLKSNFFTGLLVLVPLLTIAWLMTGVMAWLWQLKDLLPGDWNPENFLPPALAPIVNMALTLGLVLISAIAISTFGWISKLYLGKKLLSALGHVIEHIPVVRSVYSALDQLLRTLAAQGSQQFSRVVYIEYPRKGIWALAFVTSPAKDAPAEGRFLNVYIPTTPNPTSGFHLLVPESEVRDSHLRVEEAFKILLSLGIAQPEAPHEP